MFPKQMIIWESWVNICVINVIITEENEMIFSSKIWIFTYVLVIKFKFRYIEYILYPNENKIDPLPFPPQYHGCLLCYGTLHKIKKQGDH